MTMGAAGTLRSGVGGLITGAGEETVEAGCGDGDAARAPAGGEVAEHAVADAKKPARIARYAGLAAVDGVVIRPARREALLADGFVVVVSDDH